jgi:hypothetical protein
MDTSHDPMAWQKAVTYTNSDDISVTMDTSHNPNSSFKEDGVGGHGQYGCYTGYIPMTKDGLDF